MAVLSVPMVVAEIRHLKQVALKCWVSKISKDFLINSRNIQQIEFTQVLQNEALHRRLSRWHVAGIHPSRRERRDVHPCSSVWRFSKPRTPQIGFRLDTHQIMINCCSSVNIVNHYFG